ncbi:MAG TPA: methyltransferase [Kofleriaceae bacterium]|nr:methyltransferase [Kofleriaceae bacterium]
MSESSPSEVLLDMIHGYQASQMVYVAAKLGIADILKHGPMSAKEVACAVAADEAQMFRFLRGLVEHRVLTRNSDGRFALTEIGEVLRTDRPSSMHDYVLFVDSEAMYQAWGGLLRNVQTGEVAFERANGVGFFDYCVQNPEFGARFNRLAGRRTSTVAASIVAAYDFSSASQIMDVGGGNGSLLAEILEANPKLNGILFDMESVIADARHYLQERGVSARCELISGSFFDSIPRADGTYILKSILHDWDNAHCIRILENCRRCMAATSKLLVVERVIPEQIDRAKGAIASDLAMMVMLGGAERTEAEFRALFQAAGFELVRVIPTKSDRSVLECRHISAGAAIGAQLM